MAPRPTSLSPGGRLHASVRCIMFDVYGTLLISDSGDVGTLRKQTAASEPFMRLLHRYGIQKSPESVIDDFFSRIDSDHTQKINQGIQYPEVRIEQIWMEVLGDQNSETVSRFAIEFEMIVNPVFPMPHLRKMLSACRQRKFLMGIISNAQFYTPLLFGWLLEESLEGLGFHPELIYFSFRFGVAKPSPILFNHARNRLLEMGIQSWNVLYVGNDMLNDISPASDAGFQTALFAGDARSLRLRPDHPECKGLAPDIVITDLIQVLDHI